MPQLLANAGGAASSSSGDHLQATGADLPERAAAKPPGALGHLGMGSHGRLQQETQARDVVTGIHKLESAEKRPVAGPTVLGEYIVHGPAGGDLVLVPTGTHSKTRETT